MEADVIIFFKMIVIIITVIIYLQEVSLEFCHVLHIVFFM